MGFATPYHKGEWDWMYSFSFTRYHLQSGRSWRGTKPFGNEMEFRRWLDRMNSLGVGDPRYTIFYIGGWK